MKAIMSERSIKAKSFKIKIGTLNKRTPVSMYIEAGTYIKPIVELDNYRQPIVDIEKELKLQAKEVIRTLPAIEKDFILITDVAIGRIDKSRGTHYTIQFHFKPKASDITDFHKTFNQLADEFLNRYENTFPLFKDIITRHGFTCSKTK